MTKWFDYNNEDGTPGNSLPSSVNGPYYFEYNDPGTYRSDAIRSVYAELQTINNQQYYYIQSYNPNGTYGVVFDEDNQITLVAGTTYYLAGFFRFEQIDGYQIWHNSSDYDKLCGMQGSGFRWIIESGFGDVINYLSGKLTFTASVAKSSVPSWPTYDHLVPNVSPYDVNNGPYCDYSKWYAVVMGVTAYANSNGRARLWVNGNLTTDTYGQTMETGATFFRIEMNGTIGQGEGDAPAHKRQFDNIICTDDWSDIQAAGLDQDPEGGSPSATPSSTVSPSSSKSCSISRSRSKSMSQSQSSSPSPSPSGGYDYPRFVVHSSTNITDGESTTHQLVPPGAKQYEDFQDGKIHDVSNPANPIDLDIDKYTEIEWCVQATEYAEVGETYEFRVAKGE